MTSCEKHALKIHPILGPTEGRCMMDYFTELVSTLAISKPSKNLVECSILGNRLFMHLSFILYSYSRKPVPIGFPTMTSLCFASWN
jgi:hypothetical protein